jgi:dihydropteroate synthase
MQWTLRDRRLQIGLRPLVMGIVNVTPDSFSDGGKFQTTDLAVEHALRLVAEGADMLDIGGESSRPSATPVSLAEELNRVVPVVARVARQVNVPISVDTIKSEVARQSLKAGAAIVNDISAGLADPEILNVVREYEAGVVLMHMQGTPQTMQIDPTYKDVVSEVRDFLRERIDAFTNAGVSIDCIAVDPGIGFGKTLEHNLSLLRHLDVIAEIGRPIVLGVSRKGMIGQITGKPRDQRRVGSVAMATFSTSLCTRSSTRFIWRVHDVDASVDAAKIAGAILEQS